MITIKPYLFLFLNILASNLIYSQTLPTLIPYRKGDKWGYCDSAKKIIIKPQWEDVGFFSEGLAAVRIKGKYGYIDTTGKIVINYRYTSAKEFDEEISEVEIKNKYFEIIDKTGKSLFKKKHKGEFGILNKNKNGFILFSLSKKRYLYTTDLEYCYSKSIGVCNKKFKIIIPFNYSLIEYTENINFFIVAKLNKNGDLNYGLYDLSSKKEIIKCDYKSDSDSLYLVQLKKLNANPLVNHFNNSENNSVYYIIKKDSLSQKWGLIDSTSKIIIAFQYDSLYKIRNGLFMSYKALSTSKSIYNTGLIDKYDTKYFDD